MRPFILIAALVYVIGVLVGFQIEPVLAENADAGSFSVQDIAKNNLASALVTIAGGLSLGVISIVNTIYNGVILGYALSIVIDHNHANDLVKHFLPHSIEIVAIILSCALGLYIGWYILKTLLINGNMEFQQRQFITCAGLTIIIVLIAAYLEVNVSMS